MKSKIFAILTLVLLATGICSATDTITRADSAYNAKDYTEAARLYNEAMMAEGTSAGLLFNLGNAYFQTGDYGQAMVNWLRARRLDPGSKEIKTNIRFLQNRVEDANKAEQRGKRLRVNPDEQGFFQAVGDSISIGTASNTWAIWAVTLFLLFVGCSALYIFAANVILRKTGFFGGIVCFLCSLVFLIFSFMSARAASSSSTGVVIAYKVALLTEPGKDADSNKGGVLTKGTQVQVLSEEVDAEGTVTWYKVRLNSDYIGWVSASDLEIV